MAGPLKGIRIIEFAGIGPGPYCGMMLADHGAEVIRIDRPGGFMDPRDPLSRNRTSIALDMKNPEAVRIRYRAGYNGTSDAAPSDTQTGAVPERARQAVILMATHLLNTGSENLFLSVDEVDGIGRKQYVVSDNARAMIEQTCDRLLAGLRVFV